MSGTPTQALGVLASGTSAPTDRQARSPGTPPPARCAGQDRRRCHLPLSANSVEKSQILARRSRRSCRRPTTPAAMATQPAATPMPTAVSEPILTCPATPCWDRVAVRRRFTARIIVRIGKTCKREGASVVRLPAASVTRLCRGCTAGRRRRLGFSVLQARGSMTSGSSGVSTPDRCPDREVDRWLRDARPKAREG